jgi:hypothetical protein
VTRFERIAAGIGCWVVSILIAIAIGSLAAGGF